jgi:Carboxypeptidase regulatory-like domain
MTTRRVTPWVCWLGLVILPCGFSSPAHAQSQPSLPNVGDSSASTGLGPFDDQLPITPRQDQHLPGRITGKIVDPSGVAIAAANVQITDDKSLNLQIQTDEDGVFTFANVAPGTFHISMSSPGFAPQRFSGALGSGERYTVPQIVLAIASVVTEVRVLPPQIEIAQEEMKEEEKQRALGIIPNFYVSYVHDAAPLTAKQKFELAWKTSIDPVNFALTGVIAGVEQSQDDFNGYGQGAQGYAKRYGAAYADGVTDTFIGSAILPALLKQDPRYFYKGTGSTRSRILYAVANAVICKGDNGRWQPNYSGVLGGLAAGGLSNLYYPASDRNGVALTFENTLIGIGATAVTNLLQEFLIRKLTPNLSDHDPNNGSGNGSKVLSPITKVLNSFVHEGD